MNSRLPTAPLKGEVHPPFRGGVPSYTLKAQRRACTWPSTRMAYPWVHPKKVISLPSLGTIAGTASGPLEVLP